jgi:hypothetical protein
MIPTEPGWWWCVRGDTRLRVRPRIVRVVEVENGEPRIDGRLIGARSAQIAWIEPVAPIGALAAAERRAEEAEALLAEVRAELAAERGEADGALPGWTPEFDYEGVILWHRETPVGRLTIRGPRGWSVDPWALDLDDDAQIALYDLPNERNARVLMRAAEAAMAEGGA